jgi:CheY-like chemotaxis protein
MMSNVMPSVLIVDDEAQIRQLIRTTFEEAGYRVSEASNGKEALAQYRLAPTDVVITDILMPDQDGLECITTLRRESPNVKIIAITGDSNMIGVLDFLDVAKMLGADGTLQKPFEMKALVEAAESALHA